MAKDNATKNKFIELRAKGLSFDKISKDLNVTKATLVQWSRGYEVEIKNLRNIEIEGLRDRFMLTNEKRMQIISETLENTLKSLESRDFDDIPTDKLYGLLLKLLDKIEHPNEIEFVGDENSILENLDLTTRVSWKA